MGVSSDAVRVRYTKWGGRAHWTLTAHHLGEDEHGVWLAAPVGTELTRPGARELAIRLHVILFPHRLPCTAAFYERLPGDLTEMATYIDISTVPQWNDGEVTMVDLDLDIIRQHDGTILIDDEDEFAEHQVSLAYPPDVVAMAEESCAARLTELTEGVEPYGVVGQAWLDSARSTLA